MTTLAHFHRRARAAVALALCLRGASAHGQSTAPTSSLSWVRLPGAESCATARALAEAVERRLQRAVFVSSARAELSIEGRVERGSDAWIATVAITRADGTSLGARTLRARDASCRALDESIELVLLLAIDPDALTRAPPPEGPPPAAAPVAPAPSVERVRVVERTVLRPVVQLVRAPPAGPPPSPWRFGFALGGGLHAGLAPGVAPLVWGAAEVTPPRFIAIELSGVGGASLLGASLPALGVSVDASFALGGLSLCPRATIGERARLGGCVGAQLGPLRWTSDGAAGRRADDFLMATVSARASVAWVVRRPFEAQLDAGATVPLVRPKFVVGATRADGSVADETVFEAGPIAAQLTVSAVVRFSP